MVETLVWLPEVLVYFLVLEVGLIFNSERFGATSEVETRTVPVWSLESIRTNSSADSETGFKLIVEGKDIVVNSFSIG